MVSNHRSRTRHHSDNVSGKRHAVNFHDLTQRATVVAASTPDADERRWAEANLEGVKIYADFDQMLEQESLHAVVVASATSVHAEQALKAITKGYHVLCEKPLSIDLNVVSAVCRCCKDHALRQWLMNVFPRHVLYYKHMRCPFALTQRRKSCARSRAVSTRPTVKHTVSSRAEVTVLLSYSAHRPPTFTTPRVTSSVTLRRVEVSSLTARFMTSTSCSGSSARSASFRAFRQWG